MNTTTSLRPAWLPAEVWPYPLGELQVAGRRVVYTDTGGDKPVLLMVHVGLWSMLWGGLIARLHDEFRCITLDVPGSGLSERVPAAEQTMAGSARAIGALVEGLDLTDVTLIVHDTGGVAGLAAVSDQIDRVAGLVAVNTLAWEPRGFLWLALRLMGSAVVREVNALLGLIAFGSATRFGVGKHFDRAHRRAWRAGLKDRASRGFMHRMFRDVVRDGSITEQASETAEKLADRPMLTVFGQLGDYFLFRRRWTKMGATEHCVVPLGLHFPMCDNPELVARTIREWHGAS